MRNATIGAMNIYGRQLNEALTSRSVIDQARGILIAPTGCTAEEAIATLKQRSQRDNRKLREIATDIVDDAIGHRAQC